LHKYDNTFEQRYDISRIGTKASAINTKEQKKHKQESFTTPAPESPVCPAPATTTFFPCV